MPTALLIGGKERTAPGANRAPVDAAQRLGISQATLVPFPELGHSPQVEAPQVFHKALLRVLNEAR